MLQRSFSVFLLLLCAALAVVAFGYQAPFSYEPVGPRAWPLLLLLLIGVSAVGLLFSQSAPQHEEKAERDHHLSAKVSGCVLLLLAYSALFEVLGFIPSAMLLGMGLARLYGGRWSVSVASGLILGIGLYLLFDKALDVPLPLGVLSDWEI